MRDGEVLALGEVEVVGVESHLLDSLLMGELVASTALGVGRRDIIEPSGGEEVAYGLVNY
jgi:hypothetical protein